MQASLLNRWFQRLLIAGTIAATFPTAASAIWPWARPAPQPAIPVGPPIFTPTTPRVVGYQPAPAFAVPAANVAPTLGGPVFAPAPGAIVAAPAACGQCSVAPRVTNYAPPNYQTTWGQVPTTTYRPVASIDPATGLPINAVQPCTTNVWQARRVPNNLWGGLWPATTAPPTVVAYTPATIAAYPAARVTNYAPPPTILAPSSVVTQYAPPVVTQYAPAPVQYAPAPTQFTPAPQPQFAPAPQPQFAPAPAATPCPHGCPHGGCQGAAPPVSSPAAPTPATQPGSYQSSPQVPARGAEAADLQPRLDGTARNYPPINYDNEPVVPVTPPVERRVIEIPRSEGPTLQSPQLQSPQSSHIRSPSPFVPFARPAEKPASTSSAPRNLRLVPDPDAERLDLRRDEIPSLIKPGDRTTSRTAPSGFASVPIAWPAQTTTLKPEVRSPRLVPVAMPAAEKLDDSGWQSLAR